MDNGLNLGVRAHDLGKNTPSQLALKVSAYSFSSIQLALHKALTGWEAVSGRLSPGAAASIRDTLMEKGVRISVLGCYINPIHPDTETRNEHMERFVEHIQFARDFGCSIVATETGSVNADCSYNPATYTEEVYRDFLRSVEKMVEKAEEYGVFAGIEPVAEKHTIDSPEKMLRLIGDIRSDHLKVVFDPVNILTVQELDHHEEVFRRSFDLFGEHIAVVHAKDFKRSPGIDGKEEKIGNLPAGKGGMNYADFFRLLKKYKPGIDVLLENSSPENMEETSGYLHRIYNQV